MSEITTPCIYCGQWDHIWSEAPAQCLESLRQKLEDYNTENSRVVKLLFDKTEKIYELEAALASVRAELKLEREAKQWMKDVVETSGQGIKDSAIFASIFTKDFMEEPRCALELGLAILLMKPIVLITREGTPIPVPLLRIADHIEFFNEGNKEDAFKNVRVKIVEILERIEREDA